MKKIVIALIILCFTVSAMAGTITIGKKKSGATLKDSNTAASAGVYQIGRYAANLYECGNFTAGSSYTMTSFKLYLTRVGTATGTLTGFIYSTTSGAPTSQLSTCSTTVNRSTLPTSETAVEFSGCNQAITSGTEYCLGAYSSEVNGDEDVRINYSAGGGTYTHEMYNDGDGTGTWGVNNDEFIKFETYGN